MKNKQAFTLIELLIVVLIIGILAAVAVPQYQKAVLKSRYSAMMPIAKSLAEANEVYFLGRGEYATSVADLDVVGQADYPDGTQVSMPQEEESLSYVLVTNDSVPNARYLVYQKHSPSFPDTTMCEAGDERTNELCQSLGGVTLPSGGNSLGSADWTAYLLSGDATGSSFCPAGATCNSEGQVTQCPSGKTLKEGGCVTCDIENAVTCSTTSYAATECDTGYRLSGGACEEIPTCGGVEQPADETKGCGKNYTGGNKTRTASCVNNAWTFGNTWDTSACEADPNLLAQLQAVATEKCSSLEPVWYSCTVINGTVSVCDKRGNTLTAEGECVWNGRGSTADEHVYNPDGTLKARYFCSYAESDHCYAGGLGSYNAGVQASASQRTCADKAALSKDGVCANGQYDTSGQGNVDSTYDSYGRFVTKNYCSAVNAQGVCTAYSEMSRVEYPTQSTSVSGFVKYICTDIKPNSTECLEWEQQ